VSFIGGEQWDFCCITKCVIRSYRAYDPKTDECIYLPFWVSNWDGKWTGALTFQITPNGSGSNYHLIGEGYETDGNGQTSRKRYRISSANDELALAND
jgi:hypothetical protein